MKVRLNTDLGGFKKGRIIGGNRLNSIYWRNRIRDSHIDNCLEILDEESITFHINEKYKGKKLKKQED